jgi:hypothetical protein
MLEKEKTKRVCYEQEIRFRVGYNTMKQIYEIRDYLCLKTIADTMRFMIHYYYVQMPSKKNAVDNLREFSLDDVYEVKRRDKRD